MARRREEGVTGAEDYVRINLISTEKLNEYSSSEKIDFIIGEIKEGKVLVLERGLRPEEEMQLIERTMAVIDHNTFIGIEMETYMDTAAPRRAFWRRLFRRNSGKLTVIGPASSLKTIYKDNRVVEALVFTKRGVVGMLGEG
jgi:hypothetical protein